MALDRLPSNDPRTVARDIPGIFDALFPQLTPGIVAHFNRQSYAAIECEPLPVQLVTASGLQPAMLFEVAVAAAEQLMSGCNAVDWDVCLTLAVSRQRRHFDARLPDGLSIDDQTAAQWVAGNLVSMLRQLQAASGAEVIARSPVIPGYQWIATGVGDFSVGTRLIEVKCTNKHFSSSDYRQIIMYWLLGYAASVENGLTEWSDATLINPRLNRIVSLPFGEILNVIGAGRSKVELLQLFSSMVGDHTFQMLASVR